MLVEIGALVAKEIEAVSGRHSLGLEDNTLVHNLFIFCLSTPRAPRFQNTYHVYQ